MFSDHYAQGIKVSDKVGRLSDFFYSLISYMQGRIHFVVKLEMYAESSVVRFESCIKMCVYISHRMQNKVCRHPDMMTCISWTE